MAADALDHLNLWLRRLAGYGGSLPAPSRLVSASLALARDDLPAVLLCDRGGVTITLPSDPRDGVRLTIVDVNGLFAASGLTVARNGWRIEGGAADLLLTTPGLNRTWIYRADLGDWLRATDIVLLDALLPLHPDLDADAALLLARDMSGEYGMMLTEHDMRECRSAENRIYGRYAQPRAATFDPALSGLGGNRRAITGDF
jgi:hypothetical protein